MKSRIKSFLTSENISATQLADNIGVQRSSISHIIAGRNNPGYDFIIKLLTKYPKLSSDWLLLGKGEMYKNIPQSSLFSNEPSSLKSAEVSENNESLHMSTDTKPDDKLINNPIIDIKNSEKLEKIVFFYKNNSFKEYYPKG